jgi:hypothetical protein
MDGRPRNRGSMALNSFKFFCTPTAPRPALEPSWLCLFDGHRVLFPGDKAIRGWSWSLPSICYQWLLRLIFVNILRSVGTVRVQDWSVGLVGSARDFSVNKIFSSLGFYATYIDNYRRFETTYLVPVDTWKWDRQVVTKRRSQSVSRYIPEERRSR